MIENLAKFLGLNPSILIGVLIGVVLGTIPIVKDTAESNWRKRFREQVKKGIINEQLKPEDMQHLYERWEQDRKSVLQSLRTMLSEAISGEDDNLKDKADDIRDLIAKHEEREPFSELPENISLQLNGLKNENPDMDKPITQLAASLNELYSSNKAELAKQKKFSFFGFIIGILGTLISIASLFYQK